MKFVAYLDFGDDPPMKEINGLVSKEMQQVRVLEADGIFTTLEFLNGGKQVHIHIRADTEQVARDAVESLPLHPYFEYRLETLSDSSDEQE
jgi:hypothetical protein